MSVNNPIFSHSVEIVCKLSQYFEKVHVITLGSLDAKLPANVTVFAMEAQQKQWYKKIFLFLIAYFRYIANVRKHVLFSHMPELPFLLVAPISKLLGNRTYLWYAHASKSIPLFFTRPFTTTYITSTKGSFPWEFRNIQLIGQGISTDLFGFENMTVGRFQQFIHIGRNDPSKQITTLVDFFWRLKVAQMITAQATLTFLGNTSSPYIAYKDEIISKIYSLELNEICIVKKAVARQQVAKELKHADVFVHAFLGSLDKSLIEATLCGVPVITCNREYLAEFGSWGTDLRNLPNLTTLELLISEFECLLKFSESELRNELKLRSELAHRRHNLDHWIQNLRLILVADE